MNEVQVLDRQRSFLLEPRPPYHFDANMHKPSHFPSSDNAWEPGSCWITMRWQGRRLGLRLTDAGSLDAPKIRLTVFSSADLPDAYVDRLLREIRWRFNLDQDLTEFTEQFAQDEYLGPALGRWRGMKPVAANSLYETLMVYIVLQNAVIRRSIQMLEALFDRFGRDVRFDGRTMSTFWMPQEMARASEATLRALKVGYRAKTFCRITEPFARGVLNEFDLRRRPKPEVEAAVGNLYGVGRASLSYLLYEDFYFLDDLRIIPPWEQKILSRLLFDRPQVPEARILAFFRRRYPGYEKIAFDYLWEDLFWRHERALIDWLAKEIRR